MIKPQTAAEYRVQKSSCSWNVEMAATLAPSVPRSQFAQISVAVMGRCMARSYSAFMVCPSSMAGGIVIALFWGRFILNFWLGWCNVLHRAVLLRLEHFKIWSGGGCAALDGFNCLMKRGVILQHFDCRCAEHVKDGLLVAVVCHLLVKRAQD